MFKQRKVHQNIKNINNILKKPRFPFFLGGEGSEMEGSCAYGDRTMRSKTNGYQTVLRLPGSGWKTAFRSTQRRAFFSVTNGWTLADILGFDRDTPVEVQEFYKLALARSL